MVRSTGVGAAGTGYTARKDTLLMGASTASNTPLEGIIGDRFASTNLPPERTTLRFFVPLTNAFKVIDNGIRKEILNFQEEMIYFRKASRGDLFSKGTVEGAMEGVNIYVPSPLSCAGTFVPSPLWATVKTKRKLRFKK